MLGASTPDEATARRLRCLPVILRDLREARGLTEREVATSLGWQPRSKLLRIERGIVDISVMDLCVLLHHYGVEESDKTADLIRLASHARRETYDKFQDVLPVDSNFLQHERDASILRNFEPSVVPGLLQTREYTASMFALSPIAGDTEEMTTKRIQLRTERQSVLNERHGLQASFVMDEAVIRRTVGGPDVMLRQLSHIRAMSMQPNIDIRVIPFTQGAHLGLWGGFVVLGFPSPDNSELVLVEHQAGHLTIDGRSTSVASYVERFWALEDCSSPADESRDMLERAMNDLASRTAGSLQSSLPRNRLDKITPRRT